MPYLAREKRIFSVYTKTQKKNQTLLSQFFGNEGIHFCSTFQNERIQRLFDLLEEKQIWKLSQELVWWDVTTQTIVEPEDIVWKEEVQTQLEVKCFVETKNDVFPLVIDDPLQLFSDKGVLVHPNDKRYKKHIGKKIIIPILNKSIPIF